MTTNSRTDARRRSLRTLAQGLAFTVLAALVVALLGAFTGATSWDEFLGQVAAFSFVQSIAVAGLSWLMRAHIDPWLARHERSTDDRA